jgi:hypothetical protein
MTTNPCSFARIIEMGLDVPPMTAQQLADQALIADQEARRLAKAGHERAAQARHDADAIADAACQRAAA